MKGYRNTPEFSLQREQSRKAYQRAYQQAMRGLKLMHAKEFDALLNARLSEEPDYNPTEQRR